MSKQIWLVVLSGAVLVLVTSHLVVFRWGQTTSLPQHSAVVEYLDATTPWAMLRSIQEPLRLAASDPKSFSSVDATRLADIADQAVQGMRDKTLPTLTDPAERRMCIRELNEAVASSAKIRKREASK